MTNPSPFVPLSILSPLSFKCKYRTGSKEVWKLEKIFLEFYIVWVVECCNQGAGSSWSVLATDVVCMMMVWDCVFLCVRAWLLHVWCWCAYVWQGFHANKLFPRLHMHYTLFLMWIYAINGASNVRIRKQNLWNPSEFVSIIRIGFSSIWRILALYIVFFLYIIFRSVSIFDLFHKCLTSPSLYPLHLQNGYASAGLLKFLVFKMVTSVLSGKCPLLYHFANCTQPTPAVVYGRHTPATATQPQLVKNFEARGQTQIIPKFGFYRKNLKVLDNEQLSSPPPLPPLLQLIYHSTTPPPPGLVN